MSAVRCACSADEKNGDGRHHLVQTRRGAGKGTGERPNVLPVEGADHVGQRNDANLLLPLLGRRVQAHGRVVNDAFEAVQIVIVDCEENVAVFVGESTPNNVGLMPRACHVAEY